jgi:hypothetical protein
MSKQAKFWIALLAMVLFAIITLFVWSVSHDFTVSKELDGLPKPLIEPIRVRYLQQYIEIFRIVVVGVLVALVSVLIPVVYSQAKARFERYKEARRAYSIAKTAALYLADRVLDATPQGSDPRPSEAFNLIEKAHREFHLAETFEDDIISQGFLHWYKEPRVWLLHNYWRITAVAAALRWYEEVRNHGSATIENVPASQNNSMSLRGLRTKVKETSTLVDEAFGELGDGWERYEEDSASKAADAAAREYCNQRRRWAWRKTVLQRVVYLARRRAREECLRLQIERLTISGAAIGLRRSHSGSDASSCR